MFYLTPSDVLRKGLCCIGVDLKLQEKWSEERKETTFHAHFGSLSDVITFIWCDLQTTSITAARLTEKDMSEEGFVRFMLAMYFLWTYPKNAHVLISQFGFLVCLRYVQGKELWYWPTKIASLKEEKIREHPRLHQDDTAHIAVGVDGVNYAAWELKHPEFPVDQEAFDHKHGCCGFSYEVVCEIYFSQIVHISGPHKAGKNDKTKFKRKDGYRDKMSRGPFKLAVADRGYIDKDCMPFLCIPNSLDSPELAAFKSRARCRHETLNGRFNNFKILQDKFRHGMDRHKIAFEAVCVIVQYQMDHGAPLFKM